jgi:hypothetical protein
MAAREPEGAARPRTGIGMSTAELRVSYRPDDEWNGQLIAVVTSGAFAGEGSAWFTASTVKETFLAALNAYPLLANNPPVLEPGYEGTREPGAIEFRIAVRPYNSVGTLLVQVDLATEVATGGTPDRSLQQAITTRFLTEYIALQEFAAGLARALDGAPEPAVLVGDMV